MSSAALDAELASFGRLHENCTLASSSSAIPPALVIFVSGSLDTDNSGDFGKVLIDSLAEAHARGGLILDLEGLGYISSMGIGSLVSILIESRRQHIPLKLCNMRKGLRFTIDVLGFLTFFEFVDGYERES
jgi:anti-anti-sigma factor